ncbi:MAG: monovalent cation/H+ antiporter subunit D family protein [Balneolaceae bacterium]|nr:monovalent cation/H+ antiporter subunit D family protein [Balneolaceae bacterium]
MIESHLPAYIALTFVLFSVLIPAFGLWRSELSQPLAVLGSGIAAAFSVYGFINYLNEGSIRYFFGGWEPPVGIEFVYDGLAGFFVLVINVVSFFVLIHSHHIAKREFPGKEMPYYALAMLMMLGFNGMILTGDLFNLYVFLEIASLSGYALIAIGEKQAPYAAFRYLIIGTAGGTLYLLGVGFLYTVTGTLNIIDMAAMLPMLYESNAVFAALILMIVGIGVKAALFPMHGWLPDSYTYASSVSTALIAPIGTKVAAYILFRVILWLFGLEITDAIAPLSYIVGVLACIGILYGSIMAIAQTEMKRMLAYSSVSQIGYIIMGLSLANPWGFAGALLHVLNHAIMKACLFMISGQMRLKEGHSDISRFDDSYRKKYPWTMASFSIAAISMIGLPPLAGFFSKWYLALGTIDNSNWLFLAVILISSLLNAVYFFRVLEKVYMMDPDKGQKEPKDGERNEPSASMLWPTGILAVSLIVIGFANAVIVGILLNIFPM